MSTKTVPVVSQQDAMAMADNTQGHYLAFDRETGQIVGVYVPGYDPFTQKFNHRWIVRCEVV